MREDNDSAFWAYIIAEIGVLTWFFWSLGTNNLGTITQKTNSIKIPAAPELSCDATCWFLWIAAIAVIPLSLLIIYWFRAFQISSALRKIAKEEPHWAEISLTDVATDRFILMQHAWEKQDMSTLQHHLHPELYRQWEAKISRQLHYSELFATDELRIHKVRVMDVRNFRIDARDEFTVMIHASCRETAIMTGSASRGRHSICELWTFCWYDERWVVRKIRRSGNWLQFILSPIIHERRSTYND